MASDQPSILGLLRRLVPFILRDKWMYIAAMVAAPLTTVLSVAQPWLLKTAIDTHIVNRDLPGLIEVSTLYLVLVVGSFVAEASYTLALSYGAMRTISHVRAEVYTHTLSLARSYFDRHPTGRLLTRVTSDIEALGETLTAGAITIVLDALLVVGVLGAMFSLDPKLTGLFLLFSPILAVVIDLIRRILRKLFLQVRSAMSELNAYLAERITGLSVVQLYADETRTEAEFDRRLKLYRDTTIKTNFWDAFLFAIVDGVASITMALLLWYGTGWFTGSIASAGLLAAFIEYLARLFQPIREFSQKIAVIQRAGAALEKIFGLLDVDERITYGTTELNDVHELCVQGVSFGYNTESDVVTDVDLTIQRGQTIALVGRTGSGKSTIGRLLTRAYTGYRGSITLDGVPIEALTEASLVNAIGVVQQDVQLFGGTVRFNLALGRAISDETLLEAVRLAGAESVVRRLGGLDGTVDHSGSNVSVGEGQLLNFARTLAGETAIVILDEATASVDSITEAAIQRATDALLANRTVLVIAHRLSTIMRADEILVLDQGRVIERGSHQELLRAGGVYADLFHSAEEQNAS